MDFASKGISWAESMLVKCGDICRDGIMAKEPVKIVDAVGERLRRIYEEVADDLLCLFSVVDGSDPGDDPPSSLSSSSSSLPVNDSPPGDHQRPIDDPPPPSSSSLPLVNDFHPGDESPIDEPPTPPPSSSSSPSLSSSLLLLRLDDSHAVDESPCGDRHRILDDDPIRLSSSSSLLPSPSRKIGELSCDDQQRHIDDDPSSWLPPSLELEAEERDEEFDEIWLEEFSERNEKAGELEEVDSSELALISRRAMKNHSYKKKLRDIVASNFYTARKKWASRLGARREEKVVKGTGEISTERPLSCESDWELL
ncbi:uncharacterized protein LOC144700707 [Wolffia australiana]